jgi:hypothetical protein
MLLELLNFLTVSEIALGHLFPAAILPATALGYAAYYRMAARHSGQHRFEVVDYSAMTLRAYSLEGERAAQVQAFASGLPQQMRDDWRIIDDLVVDGNCCFTSPLKIEGDLIVNGRAVFEQTVTVNGYAHIKNHATFRGGLVCKGDLIVNGLALLGSSGKPGWWVARQTHCLIVNDRSVPVMSGDLRLAS